MYNKKMCMGTYKKMIEYCESGIRKEYCGCQHCRPENYIINENQRIGGNNNG